MVISCLLLNVVKGTATYCSFTNLNEEDRDPQDEGRDPGQEDGLLRLADGAEVLGLERMHDRVVPLEKIKLLTPATACR